MKYRLRLAILVSVTSLLVLTTLFYDPTLPKQVAEVYMSCVAPRLASYSNFFNLETAPCTNTTLRAAIDTQALLNGTWHPPPSIECSWSDLYSKDVSGCIEWVSFSTKCSPHVNRLVHLVSAMNIKVTLLGLRTQWTGFGGRIYTLLRYLETLPDNRIVIFTDAEDVIPLPTCTAKHISMTFLRQETPVLFMAEPECWPDIHVKSDYPKPQRPTPYLYLNGGSYMGFAWALRRAINAAYTHDCSDDQRGFTRTFLSNLTVEDKRPLIALDYYNALFQSLVFASMDAFDLSEYNLTARIRNRHTGGTPCIFHQNGPKDDHLVINDIIQALQIPTVFE